MEVQQASSIEISELNLKNARIVVIDLPICILINKTISSIVRYLYKSSSAYSRALLLCFRCSIIINIYQTGILAGSECLCVKYEDKTGFVQLLGASPDFFVYNSNESTVGANPQFFSIYYYNIIVFSFLPLFLFFIKIFMVRTLLLGY